MKDRSGADLKDRDSQTTGGGLANIPLDNNVKISPNYVGGTDAFPNDNYVPGQQDDDDFEKVIVKSIDIALRKYISKINGEALNNSRAPIEDTSKLNTTVSGKYQTTAIYNHPKNAVEVELEDIVTYRIRLYNEGEVPGYVTQVTDHLPGYLDDDTFSSAGWVLAGVSGTNRRAAVTTSECRVVDASNNLKSSGAVGKKLSEVLIPAAENVNGKYTLSYVEIEVSCKVSKNAPARCCINKYCRSYRNG